MQHIHFSYSNSLKSVEVWYSSLSHFTKVAMLTLWPILLKLHGILYRKMLMKHSWVYSAMEEIMFMILNRQRLLNSFSHYISLLHLERHLSIIHRLIQVFQKDGRWTSKKNYPVWKIKCNGWKRCSNSTPFSCLL